MNMIFCIAQPSCTSLRAQSQTCINFYCNFLNPNFIHLILEVFSTADEFLLAGCILWRCWWGFCKTRECGAVEQSSVYRWHCLSVEAFLLKILSIHIFTCISYVEARNRYRLDVRPSVTRWYCIKTAERIVIISSPHDSPFILVLCGTRSLRNSNGVTTRGAAKQRWGVKM